MQLARLIDIKGRVYSGMSTKDYKTVMRKLFNMVDSNQDGFINLEEWLKVPKLFLFALRVRAFSADDAEVGDEKQVEDLEF